MTEQEAQVKIIEYFLKFYNCNEMIVALEMPFCEYKRRADIILVIDGLTHAVEIKTQFDNIGTLKDQIYDYKKIFDFNYIAAEGNNFSSIIKKNYGNVGILRIDKIVTEHRKSRRTKRLDKPSLLSSVDFSYMKRQNHTVIKSTKQESINESAKKMRLEECRKMFVDFIVDRFSRRSKSFFSEIGDSIHTDDLLILSRPDADLS